MALKGTDTIMILNIIPLYKFGYKVKAWVKRIGMDMAKMKVYDYGGALKSMDLPVSNEWVQIELDSMEVTNNMAKVAFESYGSTEGDIIQVDHVEFTSMVHTALEEHKLGNSLIIDKDYDGYTETGTWNNSTLKGYMESPTRYANTAGSYVTWTPNIPVRGYYDVFIYKVVHTNADPNAQIDVAYDGDVDIQYLNGSTGTSGWVYLGRFPFNAGTSGYEKYTRNSGAGRADAVKFKFVNQVIDNDDLEYLESGNWEDSSLMGYMDSTSRYVGNNDVGAYAQWDFNAPLKGIYDVSIYKVIDVEGDTNNQIDITGDTITRTEYLNDSIGVNGWIPLGRYSTKKDEVVSVKSTLNTNGNYLWADAAEFTLVDNCIDVTDETYTETGNWSTGDFLGYNDSRVRYSEGTIGDTAIWRPYVVDSGYYDVFVFKVKDAINGDTNAKISIAHNGVTDIQYLNHTTGTSDWVLIGRYEFLSGTSGYVEISCNTLGKRAITNTVKFEKVDLLIDNGEIGYTETGSWTDGTITGFNESSTRKSSANIGDSAIWSPNIEETGNYGVYIYKVVHPDSDPNSQINIIHDNGTNTIYLDYAEGNSGWVYLGTFEFSEISSVYVENLQNTSGKYAIADAVYFIKTNSNLLKAELSNPAKNILPKVGVYPNPTGNHLNVHIENNEEIIEKVSLVDINGRTVWDQKIGSEEKVLDIKIDIGRLKTGLYFLNIQGQNNVMVSKVIKN